MSSAFHQAGDMWFVWGRKIVIQKCISESTEENEKGINPQRAEERYY